MLTRNIYPMEATRTMLDRPEKETFHENREESQGKFAADDSAFVNVRGTWGNKFESVLTLVGYSVGLGNIWRFPYLCYKNGGGVFMIPFLLFLFICGLPLYYLEVCLGQFSGKNPVQVWDICPLFKGIGIVMMIVSAIYIWYYGMIIGWVYFYLIQSFYPTLGWATCENAWNTHRCTELFDNPIKNQVNTTTNIIDIVNGTESQATNTPATEFWKYRVLNLSDGIDDLGHVQWHLVGSLFLGWFILFLCLCKGVKSVGKVVYVTVLAPYALLIVLFIRGITLDGAWEGIRLYIRPDFRRLSDPQIWQDAAVQVFYSLGPAWGGVITMASFNKFHNNAFRDAAITCFADAFTAIFSGFPVFAVLGFLSKETGKPLEYFQSSGPGLVFIAYPEALSRLPVPQLWSVLFFFTLVLVGIDTSFATTETISATLVDLFHLHRYKVQTVAVVVSLLFLFSTPLAMSGGFYMFLLADWYVGTFNITITAILESVIVGWIYGTWTTYQFARPGSLDGSTLLDINVIVEHFDRCWSFRRRYRDDDWFSTEYLYTASMAITIVAFITFSPPYYGKDGYTFPDFAVVIGTLIALVPISIALIGTVFQVCRTTGTIPKRIHKLLKPSVAWLPNNRKLAGQYESKPYSYQKNLKGWLLIDIFGFTRPNPSALKDCGQKEMKRLVA